MLFLSPLALIGLLAALVPPLLHLFQRRKPPEVEFPAVRYLRQTEREAQRQVKLRHLLLMAMRVMAVVLVVLAAARPVVPGGGMALHEPTALAIVLDNSLSSGAVAGGTRVLDDLSARARETLRAAQAGDALWLIRSDGLARRGTPADLLVMTSAAAPESRRLDLSEAVGTAAALVAASGYARREVHVLSDMQASAIGNRQSAIEDSAMRDMPVLVYHPSGEPPANRGIASARPRPGVWLAGGNQAGAVEVAVAGGTGAGAAALQLAIEGRNGSRTLAAPGALAVLSAPRTEPGWRRGTVTIEPDELRADDERAVGVRVVPPALVALSSAADVGPFVVEALSVLADANQIRQSAIGNRQSGATVISTQVSGANAIVFPPADPARVGATNRGLAAAGVPWRFGAAAAREDSLVAPTVPELAGARVSSRLRLEPLAAADSSEVLARAGNDAWLVRYGGVVLVGSRMVPEQSTLPVSGSFVPFISALVNRMGRGESGVLEVVPGASVTLPARVTALGGPDSATAVQGGAVIEAPAAPGVYTLLAGSDTVGLMSVGPDARESDLTRAGDAEVSAAWAGAHTIVTDDARTYGARRFRGAGQSELTGWLLVAALTLLVLESLVATGRMAGWSGRRTEAA